MPEPKNSFANYEHSVFHKEKPGKPKKLSGMAGPLFSVRTGWECRSPVLASLDTGTWVRLLRRIGKRFGPWIIPT